MGVKNPSLDNLLLSDYFREHITRCDGGWRRTLGHAIIQGVPCPAFSSALSYYDGYRSARLPANLLQAQRDYFGAHTFERTDMDGRFHCNWTGRGGTTSSSAYNV